MAEIQQPHGDKVIPRVIEDEMKTAYLEYSMSVIVGRALPDVRDGLKPVHRRILYAMYDMGMTHNKPFKKSARIVGEVLGKYHPHGDMAVYDSMVRMAQDFSLRYPLVDGQGNWGSVDGDNAAAMRYTESRLTKSAEEMLQDIEKKTVKFVPNFDGSLEEPSVLPSKIPQLLINGSSGIAVGMATNIPPHNLKEVCAGVNAYIDNPEITPAQLMQYVQGPDFPTGGAICGVSGIKDAYLTGRGKLAVRGTISVEENKQRQRLIIDEIPYQVNKSQLIEEIAGLVRDKHIVGISDIRDESDRDGMRVVIELKSGVNSDVVINQLYEHTRLQTTFGIIMLALVNNAPKILNLRQLVGAFVEHRQDIITKRTQFELDEAEKKAHILEGLIIALENIDPIITFLKSSKDTGEAKQGLIEDYKLTDVQAQAILDMRLARLTALEQEKLREEHSALIKLIAELKAILADPKRILAIIKHEMNEVIQKYGDERRTKLIPAEAETLEEEAFIEQQEVVITITHAGYVKRLSPDTYKQQRRGGKGVIGAETKEEDFLEDIFIANTHDYLLCFTNKGKVHWLKVHQVPEAGRYAKGTAIVNLLQLEKDEKIATFIPVGEFKQDHYLFMVTKEGTVKKTSLDQFSSPRKGGILAIGIPETDALISVLLTDSKKDILIATKQGMAVRFNEEDVRPMGRTAYGVRGINLREKDVVVDALVADDTATVLTITESGFGKRTAMTEYRTIGRGGVGVTNLKVTDKNGTVVAVKKVADTDEIILITQSGIVIRTPAKGISVIGRATQGVRIIKLDEKDAVTSATIIKMEE